MSIASCSSGDIVMFAPGGQGIDPIVIDIGMDEPGFYHRLRRARLNDSLPLELGDSVGLCCQHQVPIRGHP